MNKNILHTGVQNFIEKNWNTDILSLLLKKSQFEGISQKELTEQLEAKKKCRYKLPSWFETSKIYYPNKLHVEQASSEQTAHYKAQLVSGNSLLDITGGMGIDSYYFSEKISRVFHCELNAKLSEITAHNFEILKADGIKTLAQDGLQFLKKSTSHFNWIYIDPSRRDKKQSKVFLFRDCEPNVPSLIDIFFEKTDHVLIKASPLLDITSSLSELKFVKEIHVIAVKNEVKELLFLLEKNFEGAVHIKTINLKKNDNEQFDFLYQEESKAQSIFGAPEKFLYEPNAAILKSGAFKLLGHRYQLKKLHEHSHLYTAEKRLDFPGRIFKIKKALPYSKNTINQLGLNKANITTRNFPLNVQQLRKKHSIKDGGAVYLFFTRGTNEALFVLLCEKA